MIDHMATCGTLPSEDFRPLRVSLRDMGVLCCMQVLQNGRADVSVSNVRLESTSKGGGVRNPQECECFPPKCTSEGNPFYLLDARQARGALKRKTEPHRLTGTYNEGGETSR